MKEICIDLMSLDNIPLKSENKYINTSDIIPTEIQPSIEAVSLSSSSSEDNLGDKLLISVVENIKNLDLIPLQEQSKID